MSPKARIIPYLLLEEDRLVKTTGFKNPFYVGDPLNTVRIFSDLQADEIAVLDRSAAARKSINLPLLQKIARRSERPLSYGGGIASLSTIEQVLYAGYERAVIGRQAVQRPGFVEEAARRFGRSSIAVCIDYYTDTNGCRLLWHDRKTPLSDLLPRVQGAGELILHAADRDGLYTGYDWDLARSMKGRVDVPLVMLGGAKDGAELEEMSASGLVEGCGAASALLFQGPHRAVLLSYPTAQPACI